MSIPYANRSAVAVIPALAVKDQPKVTLDEVLQDFHEQYEPLGEYFFCVQFISTTKLRITFNSATLMEDCLSAGLSLRGFPLEPQPISMKKWVSVQRLAIGIPIEAATRILGKYGKVFAGKHEIKRGIYTGTISVLMEIQTNIPSTLRIRGHTCLIFYRGQTRTCFRCQSPDHTTRDCPRYRTSATGDNPPPTHEREDPSPPTEAGPPTDSHPSGASTSASDTTAPPETAGTQSMDISPPDVQDQLPSPATGTDLEGHNQEGSESLQAHDPTSIDSGSDRVDNTRTGETDTTVPSHSTDADGPSSPRTELAGLADVAAGETISTGTPPYEEITDLTTTTTSTGATAETASERMELLAPPASYASAVDPRVAAATTGTSTPPSVTTPTSLSEDYPPLTSPTVGDTTPGEFKLPRRQRRTPARESSRTRSRSRSSSSTDSTSSSGPPTRKRTQPSLVGTGHTSRRHTRDLNITLGQFGALQDLVPAEGAVPDIRLSASGNILPDTQVPGNLRPRPTTELDSTLESLLSSK